MGIEFRREKMTTEFLDPQKNFEPRTSTLELRFDPLTGATSNIFELGYRYAPEKPDPTPLVQKSLELGCPFCPDRLDKLAPRFLPQFWPQGRIGEGDAVVFPNRDLYHTPYIAILALGKEHFIPMTAFGEGLLLQGFLATQTYFRRLKESDPRARFQSINWNYFPPAGGSIIHSHLQLLASPFPTNHQQRLLEGSRRYYRKNRSNFWADLIAQERELGERYVAATGSVHWLTPFAPRGRLWELMAIFAGGGAFADLSREAWQDFSRGLVRVMKALDSQNYISFNLSVISAVPGSQFWTVAYLRPRVVTPPMGMSDASYLDLLLEHPSTAFSPEATCQALRPFFQETRFQETPFQEK